MTESGKVLLSNPLARMRDWSEPPLKPSWSPRRDLGQKRRALRQNQLLAENAEPYGRFGGPCKSAAECKLEKNTGVAAAESLFSVVIPQSGVDSVWRAARSATCPQGSGPCERRLFSPKGWSIDSSLGHHHSLLGHAQQSKGGPSLIDNSLIPQAHCLI